MEKAAHMVGESKNYYYLAFILFLFKSFKYIISQISSMGTAVTLCSIFKRKSTLYRTPYLKSNSDKTQTGGTIRHTV